MDRTPVTSSNLVSLGHEGTILEVEFKHGGIYRYFNVPREKFDALLAADSAGKYLNAEIKPHHSYNQIDPNDPAERLANMAAADLQDFGGQALAEVLAELTFLRYFHGAAGDAFGPGINEWYEKRYAPVPKAYRLGEEE